MLVYCEKCDSGVEPICKDYESEFEVRGKKYKYLGAKGYCPNCGDLIDECPEIDLIRRREAYNKGEYKMTNETKKGIEAILFVILIILLCNSVVFIKTGEIGVVTRFGAVQERVMQAGINFKVPFIQGVKKMNCKTQKINTSNESSTKDLQDILIEASINYCVNVGQAHQLYKNVGTKYEDIILAPILADTIKTVSAEYTAEETVTKRAELSNKIYEKLNQRLNEQGISIVNVNIVNLMFSEAYNQAIEEKQIATQRTLTAQQELETAKVEAEKKKVEAEGEAEANRIINESLNSDNLQKQFIDKWNGQLPATITDNTMPFLNIN